MTAQTPIPFEPVQLRPRHDGWTAERQIRFIEALAASGCVAEACRHVGMSETSARALYNRHCGAAFRHAWDAALDCGMPRLEEAVMSRSIKGVPRPIFYKGEQVGEWRHFDERLAMFLLRRRRPARYGKWVERIEEPSLEQRDCAVALDGGLDAIEFSAPFELGNPVFNGDFGVDDPGHAEGSDSRARVEDPTSPTSAPPVAPPIATTPRPDVPVAEQSGTFGEPSHWARMDKVYDKPSDISAEDGTVMVDGPDGVAVSLTPEAAEETSSRLLDGATEASGQRQSGERGNESVEGEAESGSGTPG